jgi:hypothetical protein
MSNRPPDKFSLVVPDEQEPERKMPDQLEIVEYGPGGARPKKKLGGGAYNPYESTGNPGDTVRTRRPKVDLRKLSEWIKTTQQVEQHKQEDGEPPKPPGKR